MKKNIILMIIGTILVIVCLIGFYIYDDEKDDKIINHRIKTLELRYYPGYNISTAEAINNVSKENFVSEIRLEITGEEFDSISEMISDLTVTKIDTKNCNCVYMVDNVELIVNDKFVLSLGEEYGVHRTILGSKSFEVSEELNGAINKIIDNYNNDKLYKDLVFDTVYLEKDGEKIDIKDQKDISTIKDYRYFNVNEKEDYLTYDGGYEYVLTLDDSIKVYLYKSKIGYISNPNGESSYVIFVSNNNHTFSDFVKNLVTNNKLDLKEKLNTKVINVQYKGNKYEIIDNNKIDDIKDTLLYLSYSRPHYLEGKIEKELYSDDDIVVKINNVKYIILSSQNIGNRYFIDSDGTIYDVSEIINTNVEKYIKDLVGYNTIGE